MANFVTTLSLAVTKLFISRVYANTANTGDPSCPCIQYNAKDSAPLSVENEKLVYQPVGTGAKYEYPLDYGSKECKQHDKGKAPICDQTEPQWCKEYWCYVDRAECSFIVSRSKFFPNENSLYYSYATCNEGAVSNTFARWSAENIDGTTQLIDLVQGYLTASRSQIEDAYNDVAATAASMSQCGNSQMCNCLECVMNTNWGQKIDTSDVGFWEKSRSNLVSCLSQAIGFTYRKVAASEADADSSRVGYQYFADQLTGSYVGWPNIQWCPATGYDPRYRPWYAAGATGPKDVVIVIDVSGSMSSEDRDVLAKKAAKAILDTLTWKDHASIVQFDSEVVGVFSKTLVSVTYAQRAMMHQWIDNSDGARGGTNFYDALFNEDGEHPGAFKIIRDSVSSGKTSMCQKVIMFLTDGSASFSNEDFNRAHSQSVEHNIIFFTYALGSGADTGVPKKLACDNKGIFYKVDDGADLATIMADYYSYFAAGQEMCGPSFVEYKDAVTSTQLYAGCLAMYDRTGTDPSLLGVSCLDLNLLASVSDMKAKAGWRDMISKMSDLSKTCRSLYLSDCHLEKLRSESASKGAETCSGGPSGPCPCLASGCTDDTTWLDEKGYFCDTWIGDDCSKASSKFGYTGDGQAEVLQKCRRSCGLCDWQNPCPSSAASCSDAASAVPQESRACLTSKVSGVDIEGCLMSCGKEGNPLYAATRTCNVVTSEAIAGLGRMNIFVGLAVFFAVYSKTATV